MPQLANITVKKNDGTTDIVYTGVQPSAGDGSPAIWRVQTIGTAPAHRPELRVTCKPNGEHSQRQLKAEFSYPSLITNSTTNVTSVGKRWNLSLQVSRSEDMPTADADEAASQVSNLVGSASFKALLKEMFSAT